MPTLATDTTSPSPVGARPANNWRKALTKTNHTGALFTRPRRHGGSASSKSDDGSTEDADDGIKRALSLSGLAAADASVTIELINFELPPKRGAEDAKLAATNSAVMREVRAARRARACMVSRLSGRWLTIGNPVSMARTSDSRPLPGQLTWPCDVSVLVRRRM